MAKYAEFKHFEADKPNDTDVEKCLEQMKKDDPELKEFNLNNIRVTHLIKNHLHNFKIIIKLNN